MFAAEANIWKLCDLTANIIYILPKQFVWLTATHNQGGATLRFNSIGHHNVLEIWILGLHSQYTETLNGMAPTEMGRG